ncbi:MAG: RsmG family class I SAM-dependent methyltransferase [Gracilimonas sp.]
MKHNIQYIGFSHESTLVVRSIFDNNFAALEKYADRLIWWNEKINLVSRGVSRETILKHIQHSLVITQSELFVSGQEIIDTGTGGGLPGVPLAIVQAGKDILLNDIVSKKIIACKQMVADLGLRNVQTKAESLADLIVNDGMVFISKHAFKINDMMGMISEKPWKGVVLLKGKDKLEEELEGLKVELDIKVWCLEKSFKDEFYKGKAMVEIKRKGQDE